MFVSEKRIGEKPLGANSVGEKPTGEKSLVMAKHKGFLWAHPPSNTLFGISCIITKASLLAGVWFPLGMYCRETGYSCNDFHAEPVLGPLIRNDLSCRKCSSPPLAGSNPAVYIVGTMYLMRGIMMTKHKGFLSAHPLSNTFLDIIYIYVLYMWIVRYIR